MALLVNKELSSASGLQVPSGAIILSQLTFLPVRFNEVNENQFVPIRTVEWNLSIYVSLQDFFDRKHPLSVLDFPTYFSKEMTETEYTDVLSNGALAESWLKAYVEQEIGVNTVSIFNPFA